MYKLVVGFLSFVWSILSQLSLLSIRYGISEEVVRVIVRFIFVIVCDNLVYLFFVKVVGCVFLAHMVV